MKIMHITKKYLDILAGDSIVVANLQKQQEARGHSVVILTSKCDTIVDGKGVYNFGLKDTANGLDSITLKRLTSLCMLMFKAFTLLRVERPDVIHTHSIDMAFAVSLAAHFYRIPIVHTFHIVTFNDPQQAFIRRKSELLFLRGARPDKILILNPIDIKDFRKAGFSNIVFIPNGVNIEDWRIAKNTVHKKKFTFITVGRLEQQKGLNYLIDVAATLRKEGANFEVLVVGEGSLRQRLENQVKVLDLGSHVRFLGLRRPMQLRKLYATSDCFVLSSLWEAFPLVLLEAWAACLPVIATKVGAVTQIAKDAAILIDSGDTNALKKAMNMVMNDTTYRQLLKRKSSVTAKQYRWENVNRAIEAEYKSVTEPAEAILWS